MVIHEYGIELGENDPYAEEPKKIKVTLKPHQLTSLHKCIVMETQRTLHYNVSDISPYMLNTRARERDVRDTILQGQFEISTNVGVIGDIVGYGKTFIALGIISEVPCQDIYLERSRMFCHHGCHSSYFRGVSAIPQASTSTSTSHTGIDSCFHTTLVVVPRGPVYIQWKNAIQKQTSLKCLFIDNMFFVKANMPPSKSTRSELKEYFEQYDMVLIKSTTLKSLWDFYIINCFSNVSSAYVKEDHPFYGWDRIMIDEAHDELSKVHSMRYKFLWLITSTHEMILHHMYNCNGYISHTLKDVLDEEKMLYMLVKSRPDYVRKSFNLPRVNELYYICKLSSNLVAIQSFISPAIMLKIHANDIVGAIKDLGGTDESEDNLVDLVCKDLQCNIHDKMNEIAFVEGLQTASNDQQRAQRIQSLKNDLDRLHAKQDMLKSRITQLAEQQCPICLSSFENPILLNCTHIFCGACLMNYLHTNRDARDCPMCRNTIEASKLIAIVKYPIQKAIQLDDDEAKRLKNGHYTKEEVLMKIIHNNEHGRFLVFSKQDASFIKIKQLLTSQQILYAEIKGSTGQMMNILERFKAGTIRVVLLNTHHAGSGIDLSCATDVIIFHHMGQEKTQAIGRAQRVGRTQPLNVHFLYYPSECL